MVREVVRYGSLRGRRGRLPSKVKAATLHSNMSTIQSLNTNRILESFEQSSSPPLPILTIISKALTEQRNNNNANSLIQTNVIIFVKFKFNFFLIFKKLISLMEITSILDYEFESLYRFVLKIPDISEIVESDLKLLLVRNFFPIFVAKQAFR